MEPELSMSSFDWLCILGGSLKMLENLWTRLTFEGRIEAGRGFAIELFEEIRMLMLGLF